MPKSWVYEIVKNKQQNYNSTQHFSGLLSFQLPNKAEKKDDTLSPLNLGLLLNISIWSGGSWPKTYCHKHRNRAIFSQLYMGKLQVLQNSHIIWQIYVPTFWIVNSWSISLSPGKTGCQKPKIRKKQKGKLKSRLLPKKTFLHLINQIKTVESLSNWLGWHSSGKILFNH